MQQQKDVLVPLPAGLVTVVQAPRPAVVTQHNSLEHFGLPPKDFKRLCADGKLPAKRHGRTWAVDYDAGRKALTDRAAREAAAAAVTDGPPPPTAPPPPPVGGNGGTYEAKLLAESRARRAKRHGS